MRKLKYAIHALLFLLAFAAFYAGLGLGLQYNPTYGTLLWILAALVAGLNILWIIRSEQRKELK